MDRNDGSQADSSPLTQIYFWGSNTLSLTSLSSPKIDDRNGLLGPDKNPRTIYTRPQPFDFGVKIDSISCGDSHAAFVSDGYIYTMGDNSDGRLGILKNIKSASSPMLIENLIKFYVVKVACGATHTIALTDSGEVFVWGNGESGQLGLGTRQNQLMPQQIKLHNSNETPNKNTPQDSAIDVSSGTRHSGVVTSSGEIYMFGNNEFGQLGDGTNQDKFAPVKITLPGEKAQRIACGNDYTLVLTAKGHIYGFGLNSSGQLGIGNQDDTNIPARSLLPESVFISRIMTGYHSAAITSHGEMYVWGESALGNFLIPREITWDDDMSIVGLEMGEDFTIVIDNKERVWGFGNNTKGELAQGDLEEKDSLVQIADLSSKKVKAFACGKEFVIALTDFGNSEIKIPRNSSSIKYIKEVQDSERAVSQSEIQYEEADDSVIRQESELGSVSDRFSHPHHGGQHHHGHHHMEHKPTRGSRNSKGGGVWKEFETNMNDSNTEDQIENSEISRNDRDNKAHSKGDNVRNMMVDIKILRLQNVLLEKQLEESSQQIGYLRRKVKESQTKRQKIRDKEQKYKEVLLNLEAQSLKFREEGLRTSEELIKKKSEIEKFKTALDEKNATIESLLKDNNTLKELVHYFIQLRTMTPTSPQSSSELEIRISNLLGSLNIGQAKIFNAATVAAAAHLKSAMTQNTDSSRLHTQYDRHYSPSNSPQSRATVLKTQSSSGLTPIKEYGLEQSSIKNTTPNRETIQPNHKTKKLSIKIGSLQSAGSDDNDEHRPTANALNKDQKKFKTTKPNAKSVSSLNLASFPTPKSLIPSYNDFPKPMASVKHATTASDKFTSLHKKKFSEPTLNMKPIHTQYGEERNLKQVVNNYIRTLPTENDKMGYHSYKSSSRESRDFQFNTVTTPVKEKSKKIVPTLQISPFQHEDSRRPESSQLYKKLLDMLHVPFKSTPTSTVNTVNSAKSGGPKLSAQLNKQNYFK